MNRPRILCACFAAGFSIFVGAFACAADPAPEPTLEKLNASVWLHKSYEIVEPWGPVLSHGIIVKTADDQLVLIDTAWNDPDTNRLLDLISTEFGAPPGAAIVTHAHNDKMGGVAALHAANVPTFAHAHSNADAPGRGLTPAKYDLSDSKAKSGKSALLLTHKKFAPKDGSIELFYPGPGHSRDNIVVYHPATKTLFAGCLVRPGGAKSLGNTADGDIDAWADTVRRVGERFPDAQTIIPSHGAPGGRELLTHTIALAEAEAKKKPQ
ncbi:MAG: subclass B1 metallo-beta-lactamase [Pseudomonadota bacterium]